jgi:hypothetical protein
MKLIKRMNVFIMVFLVIGMTMFEISFAGADELENAPAMDISVTGNTMLMESATEEDAQETYAPVVDGTVDDSVLADDAQLNVSSSKRNQSTQSYEQPARAVIPAVTAFSDSTTSQKFVYVSNTSTLTAGYATTQPADPLSLAGYNKGAWGSSVAASWSAPPPWNWYYSTDAPFGSGAYWISTAASTEAGSGDQWRLYKVDFDIPYGADLTSAQVWYTADNAVAVYLNDEELGSAGTVYGLSSDTTPVYQHAYNATFTPYAGSNTLKFVVRNWASPYSSNPTGLLYKVAIEYEPQQTEFTVYSDGVSLYHGYGGNVDLYRASTASQEFYTNISGKQGDPYSSIHWQGIGNPVNDATGSRNWNINEDANSMANNADFAFHAGHGGNDGILFGTANPDYNVYRWDMQFGGNNGKAKWVALLSCDVLNQSAWTLWKPVFNGVHILMGYDTHGLEGENQGSQFAQRMTASGSYFYASSIRDSWRQMLQSTIHDQSYKGAYMWAEPCSNDFLPGFGGSCQNPMKDSNGQYTIYWETFECHV